MIHTTVEAFADATGFSVEMIRAHNITSLVFRGVVVHRLDWGEGGRV